MKLLVLSSRSSDEEGNPQGESFFVEDAGELRLALRVGLLEQTLEATVSYRLDHLRY